MLFVSLFGLLKNDILTCLVGLLCLAFIRSLLSVFERFAVSCSLGFNVLNRFPPFPLKLICFALGYFYAPMFSNRCLVIDQYK